MRSQIFAAVTLPLLASSCTGKLTYSPPAPAPTLTRSVTIHDARERVWKALVPRLAQTFFVINNIDQASGLINVSYTGDPERFVDCGTITVTKLEGSKTREFPAARAQERYEISNGLNTLHVTRIMSLEGRLNVVLETVSPAVTLGTVNVRYVLTKRERGEQTIGGPLEEHTESVSFNSGESAAFPAGTTCHSTGELERQLLGLLSGP